MKIWHKRINFQDSRGSIRDIFENEPKQHCTILFSKKGAIRGNHFHKKTTQYTYIVSGDMLVASKKLNSKKIHKYLLKPGDLVEHKPKEVHAMLARKDTVFLAFTNGVRGGKEYERDTFRVNPGLITEKKQV